MNLFLGHNIYASSQAFDDIPIFVYYAPSIRLFLLIRENLKLDMRDVDKLMNMSSLRKR